MERLEQNPHYRDEFWFLSNLLDDVFGVDMICARARCGFLMKSLKLKDLKDIEIGPRRLSCNNLRIWSQCVSAAGLVGEKRDKDLKIQVEMYISTKYKRISYNLRTELTLFVTDWITTGCTNIEQSTVENGDSINVQSMAVRVLEAK